jgi:hypothetical protein
MNKRWTYDEIKSEARKFTTRWEFQNKSRKAYDAAKYRKILDDVCSHMDVMKRKWTFDECLTCALEFENKNKFYKKYPNQYNFAKKQGFIDEICSHMTEVNTKWTDEMLYEEAKKFSSRKDFSVKSRSAYQLCMERRILNDACIHMKYKHIYWNDDLLMEEAKKYNNRTDFRKYSESAYTICQKRKILSKVCEHMPKTKPFEKNVKYLFYYIKFILGENCYYKIGITKYNNVIERIKTMKLIENIKYEILKEIEFDNFYDAFEYEKIIKEKYREFRYKGEMFIKNGHSELFTINILENYDA